MSKYPSNPFEDILRDTARQMDDVVLMEPDSALRTRLQYVTGRTFNESGRKLEAIAAGYGLRRRVVSDTDYLEEADTQ